MPSLEITKTAVVDLVLGPKVRLNYCLRSPPALFLSGFPRGKMMESFHIRIRKNVKIQTSRNKKRDGQGPCICKLKQKKIKQKNFQKVCPPVLLNIDLEQMDN